MKILQLAVAALLALASGIALADRYGEGSTRVWESNRVPPKSGSIRETNPPRVMEFQREQREIHDHDRPREHERDYDRPRVPVRPGVIIGVPVIVGPEYRYNPPPVYVQPTPQYFEENGVLYWYYCPDLGYFPYVQNCPGQWLKVIPNNP